MLKCLYPDCHSKNNGKKKFVRGLCEYHYNEARKFINGGLTTWEKLEKEGKAIFKGAGRPQDFKFKTWLTSPTNKQDSNVQ